MQYDIVMSEERRKALVAAGRAATRAYFDLQPVAAPAGVTTLAVPQDPVRMADSIATRLLQ